MGGFVGDVLGSVGDVVGDVAGGVGDIAGNALKGVASNPVGLVTGLATGNYAPLLGSALGGALSGGATTPTQQAGMANLNQGLLGTYGNVLRSQVSKEAIQAAQEEARRAGQQAAAMGQFRPIGITTRFGASQFQVDPTTGQLTSAGYTTSPELQAAQERLMGLGAGYLAKTPEQVAADYMARQQELLAPSRERQMAQLQNQLFQTGRGGLSVGATGARPSGAAGLGATTPEMEAYYNALAQQDAALAAQAQQAGQQQLAFGAGLFGQAGQLEQLAQQPLTLGTQLGGLAAQYGAGAGRLGLAGGLQASEIGLRPELQYSQTGSILNALTSPTSTMSQGLGGLFGNLGGLFGGGRTVGNIGDTSAFDYAYGGGGFY